MRADFSRLSYEERKHYAGMLHQQGRVWLDADWNEEVFSRLRLLERETFDIIGACGAPDPGTAFAISPPAPGDAPDDFRIAGGPGPEGRFYVDGILCQLDAATTYLRQPDLPDAPRIPVPPEGDLRALVYLEVWRRLITYLEDPELREIALGGPDTAVRLRTIAQVKVVTVTNPDTIVTCENADELLPKPGQGTLTTLQPADVLPGDLCRLPDPANYTGRENRLYRVEIHDAGDVLGADGGSAAQIKLAADAAPGDLKIALTEALAADQSAAFGRSGVVLLSDDDGQTETVPLAAANPISADGRTLTLARGLRRAWTTAANATITGGVARFKWSRDNAAFAVGVTAISEDRRTLTLSALGRDQATALRQGDLVEISDDAHELGPARGHLTRLLADPDPDQFTASIEDALPADFGAGVGTVTLRRWDGVGLAQRPFGETTTPDMNLGDGVHIQFNGFDLRPGDYWQFAARSADGSVEILTDSPPVGIERHHCPLAVVRWGRETRFEAELVVKTLVDLQIISARRAATLRRDLAQSGRAFLTLDEAAELTRGLDANPEQIKALRERLAREAGTRQITLTIVEDCRPKFPPLTRLTHLYYVSGDGQEAAPGTALPQPLQAGVALGPWPIEGARVRFRLLAGNGVLRGGGQEGPDIVVLSGPDGVADCAWQLDQQTPSQRVEATLVSGAALPVRFNANLDQARGQDPGVHITRVFSRNANNAESPLQNDITVTAGELAGGSIRLECDAAVDPATLSRPTAFLTVEVPFVGALGAAGTVPAPVIVPAAGIAYQTLVLAGDVGVEGNVIFWRPTSQVSALLTQLPLLRPAQDRGILARLTLKGNFLWAGADPERFLDGDTFGIRAPVAAASITHLRLPSGDGRRGGDFTLWFWLVQPAPTIRLTRLSITPGQVVGGQGVTPTGTVVLSGPAPAGGATLIALASNNPNVASAPANVAIPAGQTQATFPVTTRTIAGNPVTVVFTATFQGESQTANLVVTAPIIL